MSDEAKPALINVKDLAGLSGPLTKLIETVGAGGGRIADGVSRIANAYWLASRDAKNEAERIQLVEGAKTQAVTERAKMLGALAGSSQRELKSLDIVGSEVTAQLAGIPADLIDLRTRSANRLAYENMVQQLNWESVTGFAAEALADESTVADEPVSPDWTTRLRNIAQDISTEEMQVMWGKVLAGEIKNPGSYSLRTLEVLRNLTQREAEALQVIAGLVLTVYSSAVDTKSYFIHNGDYRKKHIEYSTLLTLFDCGLLQPVTGKFGWPTKEDGMTIGLQAGKYIMTAEGKVNEQTRVELNTYSLTLAGAELAKIAANDTPFAYIEDLAKSFKLYGLVTSYAQFTKWDDKNDLFYEEPLVNI